MDNTWNQKFSAEIERAFRARADGNEGMSRVCSRRAAGIVIKEYFRQKSRELPRLSTALIPGASALNHLKVFCDDPDMPEDAKAVASHFLLQLQLDHTLPGSPDLIADAIQLKDRLLSL